MPQRHTESRKLVFHNSAMPVRYLYDKRKEHMSRTIEVITAHMAPPSKRKRASANSRSLTARWQSGLERIDEVLPRRCEQRCNLTIGSLPDFLADAGKSASSSWRFSCA